MKPCNLLLLCFVGHARAFLPTPIVSHLHDGRSTSRGSNNSLRSASGLTMSTAKNSSAADKLRDLLSRPEILTMPCCYDGLTAKLVEQAGFPLTFMTGFGVSGAHGLPDTQVTPCAVLLLLLLLMSRITARVWSDVGPFWFWRKLVI